MPGIDPAANTLQEAFAARARTRDPEFPDDENCADTADEA